MSTVNAPPDDVAAVAHLHAGRVAAVSHGALSGRRNGAAHTPKFQPCHAPMKPFCPPARKEKPGTIWCVFMMPLELFFRDKARCEGIPTPFPTRGGVVICNPSFVHKRFVVVSTSGRIPDFGRFYGSRGSHVVEAALAKNLPHRSRENEFSAGRVGIFVENILQISAVKRNFDLVNLLKACTRGCLA